MFIEKKINQKNYDVQKKLIVKIFITKEKIFQFKKIS